MLVLFFCCRKISERNNKVKNSNWYLDCFRCDIFYIIGCYYCYLPVQKVERPVATRIFTGFPGSSTRQSQLVTCNMVLLAKNGKTNQFQDQRTQLEGLQMFGNSTFTHCYHEKLVTFCQLEHSPCQQYDLLKAKYCIYANGQSLDCVPPILFIKSLLLCCQFLLECAHPSHWHKKTSRQETPPLALVCFLFQGVPSASSR